MTIAWRVQQQYFTSASPERAELIRLPPTILPATQLAPKPAPQAHQGTKTDQTGRPKPRTNLWTVEEHERFLLGLELFRHGPWKEVANVVGTKTTRQTMTHAQKYRQKIERRQRLAEAIESMAHAALPPLPHFDTLVSSNLGTSLSPSHCPYEIDPTPFSGELPVDGLPHGTDATCDKGDDLVALFERTDLGDSVTAWNGEFLLYIQ